MLIRHGNNIPERTVWRPDFPGIAGWMCLIRSRMLIVFSENCILSQRKRKEGRGSAAGRQRSSRERPVRFIAFLVIIVACYLVARYLIRNLREWFGGASGERPVGSRDRRPPRGTTERMSPEERHSEVLGITRDDGPDDIKRKYRELLAKYHPDKVQHLGREFQDMAEFKTRQILEAYRYFQKKHGL